MMRTIVFTLAIYVFASSPLRANEINQIALEVSSVDYAVVEALKAVFIQQGNFWKDYQTLIGGFLSLIAGLAAIYAGRRAYEGAMAQAKATRESALDQVNAIQQAAKMQFEASIEQAKATREASEKHFEAVERELSVTRDLEENRIKEDRRRFAACAYADFDCIRRDILSSFNAHSPEEMREIVSSIIRKLPYEASITNSQIHLLGTLEAETAKEVVYALTQIKFLNKEFQDLNVDKCSEETITFAVEVIKGVLRFIHLAMDLLAYPAGHTDNEKRVFTKFWKETIEKHHIELIIFK